MTQLQLFSPPLPSPNTPRGRPTDDRRTQVIAALRAIRRNLAREGRNGN